MNRRIFLKSLAAACGAAVVCPGELLKSKCKHDYRWLAVKNSDAPVWCSPLDYDKHHHYEHTCTLCGFTKYVEFRPNPAQKAIIENARQQGMTVTIYDEFVQQNPYIDYPYGIPYWVWENRNETYQT